MHVRITPEMEIEVTPGSTPFVLHINRNSIRHAVAPGGRGLTLCGIRSNWTYTSRLASTDRTCLPCRRLVTRAREIAAGLLE